MLRRGKHAKDIDNEQHLAILAVWDHQRLAFNACIPAHPILPRSAEQHPHLARGHLGITFVGIQIQNARRHDLVQKVHVSQELDIGNSLGTIDRQLALPVEEVGPKTPHHCDLILHQVFLPASADTKPIALGRLVELIRQRADPLPRRRSFWPSRLLHPVAAHVERPVGPHQRHPIGFSLVLARAQGDVDPLSALGSSHKSIEWLQHAPLRIFGYHAHEEKTQIGQVVALYHGIVKRRPLVIGDVLLFNGHAGMFRLEPLFPYPVGLEFRAHPGDLQDRVPVIGNVRAAEPDCAEDQQCPRGEGATIC